MHSLYTLRALIYTSVVSCVRDDFGIFIKKKYFDTYRYIMTVTHRPLLNEYVPLSLEKITMAQNESLSYPT